MPARHSVDVAVGTPSGVVPCDPIRVPTCPSELTPEQRRRELAGIFA